LLFRGIGWITNISPFIRLSVLGGLIIALEEGRRSSLAALQLLQAMCSGRILLKSGISLVIRVVFLRRSSLMWPKRTCQSLAASIIAAEGPLWALLWCAEKRVTPFAVGSITVGALGWFLDRW